MILHWLAEYLVLFQTCEFEKSRNLNRDETGGGGAGAEWVYWDRIQQFVKSESTLV